MSHFDLVVTDERHRDHAARGRHEETPAGRHWNERARYWNSSPPSGVRPAEYGVDAPLRTPEAGRDADPESGGEYEHARRAGRRGHNVCVARIVPEQSPRDELIAWRCATLHGRGA